MPITCLNISFFSDKGIEKSMIKLELRMREFLTRSSVDSSLQEPQQGTVVLKYLGSLTQL